MQQHTFSFRHDCEITIPSCLFVYTTMERHSGLNYMIFQLCCTVITCMYSPLSLSSSGLRFAFVLYFVEGLNPYKLDCPGNQLSW